MATNETTYRSSLQELIDFVRIPNNVYIPEQIQTNAQVLKRMMEKRGIAVELWQTPEGSPFVYGELLTTTATNTVLIYGHYDGVPVIEDMWDSEPFEPIFRKQDCYRETFQLDGLSDEELLNCDLRIYGRSVADSKNSIVAVLAALDILKNRGITPSVNLKFLFDGEEEVESPGLEQIIESHKEKLIADVVISVSGETHQSGLPTVMLGLRGILQFDLTVFTMATDLHSGHFGNFAPNANLRLANLLSSMKNDKGHILIPGFYEQVQPLLQGELEEIRKIPKIEEVLKKRFGIHSYEHEGVSLQELLNKPTFNIRGMLGGYIGDSASNIIPSKAEAEIDIRLVKGMDPAITMGKIISHIENEGWTILDHEPSFEELLEYEKVIKLEEKGSFPATRTSLDSFAAQYIVGAVRRAVEEQVIVMPTDGGSLRLYFFEKMGIPVIELPTSNYDCNQHSHNENLHLSYFYRAINIFTALFSS